MSNAILSDTRLSAHERIATVLPLIVLASSKFRGCFVDACWMLTLLLFGLHESTDALYFLVDLIKNFLERRI
jgi:hypothetical protein